MDERDFEVQVMKIRLRVGHEALPWCRSLVTHGVQGCCSGTSPQGKFPSDFKGNSTTNERIILDYLPSSLTYGACFRLLPNLTEADT